MKAIKTVFLVLIALGCLALSFTGVGAVVGVPVLWCIAKIATKNM